MVRSNPAAGLYRNPFFRKDLDSCLELGLRSFAEDPHHNQAVSERAFAVGHPLRLKRVQAA